MLPALIASDVDGTLLDPAERITARTRDAVLAAVASGAHFVLATGRPPRWIPPVVEELGYAPMAVCANGAVIYDAASDRVVSARTLSVDVLAELAEIATRVVPGVGLAAERVGRSAHDSATPQFVSAPGYEHAWLNPDNTEVSVEDLLSSPVVKLLVRKPGMPSSQLAAALAKHIGVLGDITYSTNDGLLEISQIGISKALGVAEGEEVRCVGDVVAVAAPVEHLDRAVEGAVDRVEQVGGVPAVAGGGQAAPAVGGDDPVADRARVEQDPAVDLDHRHLPDRRHQPQGRLAVGGRGVDQVEGDVGLERRDPDPADVRRGGGAEELHGRSVTHRARVREAVAREARSPFPSPGPAGSVASWRCCPERSTSRSSAPGCRA